MGEECCKFNDIEQETVMHGLYLLLLVVSRICLMLKKWLQMGYCTSSVKVLTSSTNMLTDPPLLNEAAGLLSKKYM